MVKKFKKFLFGQRNIQILIIRFSASILSLLLIVSILGLISPFVFHYTIPIVLCILILLSALLLLRLVQFLKAVKLIDENAIILSQGNLNISDIISEKTKGLEILTAAINDMKRNLLSYIESTKNNVIILSDAVDKVTKSIDMTYKGNEQIASNISVVAEKAQEQLNIATSTLEGIEKVSSGAGKITTTLGNIENFVEDTVKLTSDGANHLDKYTEQIQLISSNLDETASFTQTLNSNLSEINEFGNLIMNIAGQLNLLSLNSRVEAARAGEAGKGFAVVAMEMNKLSNATRENVTHINNLLKNIIKSNAKVSESIGNVTESFAMSREIFNSVRDSFYTINNNANILNSDIKNVYEESIMISESTRDISKQGSLLHDASNEISNITHDVAAVTEEELAENEEISEQALSLKKMLSSIENLLKRYRTAITPVEQSSSKRLKFIMVSPVNSSFWTTVRQGALYAQTELKEKNTEIELLGFERADKEFMDMLLSKVNEGCDGLILPGFVKDIEAVAQKANEKRIPVMAFNCDFVDSSKRLSYFGPNIQAEGTLAAEILARSIDEEGEILIFKGNSKSSMNCIRRDAAVAKLAKYSEIKIVGEIDDVESTSQVYNKLKEKLYYLPNIKGVLFIGDGAGGAARLIEEQKMIGKIKLFCFNFNDDTEEMIKKGIIHKVFRQDPFGQGHDPIIYLYNYLVANKAPESNTYTRTEIVDQYSVG